MKAALAILALIFSLQAVHADELTDDLDRLLHKLDQRTNQEISNMKGSEQKKRASIGRKRKSKKSDEKVSRNGRASRKIASVKGKRKQRI